MQTTATLLLKQWASEDWRRTWNIGTFMRTLNQLSPRPSSTAAKLYYDLSPKIANDAVDEIL